MCFFRWENWGSVTLPAGFTHYWLQGWGTWWLWLWVAWPWPVKCCFWAVYGPTLGPVEAVKLKYSLHPGFSSTVVLCWCISCCPVLMHTLAVHQAAGAVVDQPFLLFKLSFPVPRQCSEGLDMRQSLWLSWQLVMWSLSKPSLEVPGCLLSLTSSPLSTSLYARVLTVGELFWLISAASSEN